MVPAVRTGWQFAIKMVKMCTSFLLIIPLWTDLVYIKQARGHTLSLYCLSSISINRRFQHREKRIKRRKCLDGLFQIWKVGAYYSHMCFLLVLYMHVSIKISS